MRYFCALKHAVASLVLLIAISTMPTVLLADAITVRNQIIGPPSNDNSFGRQVEIVRDVNGDGVDDVAVGDPDGGNHTGSVLMYSGSDGALLWFNDGAANNDAYGISITEIDDIDGDGIEDVVAGTARGNYVRALSGASGSVLWSVSLPSEIICPTFMVPTARGFGGAITAGDFDGDGDPEVAVAQIGVQQNIPCSTTNNWVSGKWFYFIEKDTSGTWGLRGGQMGPFKVKLGNRNTYYPSLGALFYYVLPGDWLANLGDTDGDGADELLVGFPHQEDTDDPLDIYAGRVRVYSLATNTFLFTTPVGDKRVAESTQNHNYLGASVAPAGDVNGDGVPDFVAGAPCQYGGPGADKPKGYARLYTSIGGTTDWQIEHEWESPYEGNRFGRVVRAITVPAQFDEARFVLISAPGHDNPIEAAGQAYLYHIDAPYDLCELVSDGGTAQFSFSVDARADHAGVLPIFAVGAPHAGSGGKVYLYNILKTTSSVPGDPPSLTWYPPAPNPFSELATVRLQLDRPAHVRAHVYDVAGRLVQRLADYHRGTGPSSISWDGRNGAGIDVPGGVYFMRVEVGSDVRTHKVTIVR